MRITLRSLILAPAVLAAAAFTSNIAAAETLRVPFNFSINGKTMPAGEYTVQRDTTGHFVRLSSIGNTTQGYSWMLEPGDASPYNTGVTMYFDRTETAPVLRSVQYHALTTPRIDKGKYREAFATIRSEDNNGSSGQ